MKTIFLISIMFSLFSKCCFGQNVNLTEIEKNNKDLIGKWELDYNKEFLSCDNDFVKYSKEEYGQTSIELFNSGSYKQYIWGTETTGKYKVEANKLLLIDSDGNGIWSLNIKKIENDTLKISYPECDVVINWTFYKVK